MSRFLSPSLSGISPYIPGEQTEDSTLIKLNTNENPYPPSPMAIELAQAELSRMQLYPDPSCTALVAEAARYFNVAKSQMLFANGSDEILAFIFEALCPKGVAFPDVTYGFYSIYAEHYGIKATKVPLHEDFSVNIDDYSDFDGTIVIANPNAPTGLLLPRTEIEKLLIAKPDRLIVIDEAYVDFGGESCVSLTDRYDNLIVCGTFSKSRSMAGARLGYAIACEALIADLKLVKFCFNPYNVNRVAAALGLGSLLDKDYFVSCRDAVISTRERTSVALSDLGFTLMPTKTNFLYCAAPRMSGKDFANALREQGVIVRYFDIARCKDYVRVSIGTDEQMARFIDVCREISKK